MSSSPEESGVSSKEESGFSVFMKEGDCRESFTNWKNCVDKAKNKDEIVEKCFKVASALTKCMEAHSNYYDPVLHSDNKSAEEEKTVEKETPVSEDQEEEGECGLCLFMKGGGCRDAFTDWEKCIKEAEKKEEDIYTNKCLDATDALTKCMLAHSDYYEPMLRELQKEKDQAPSDDQGSEQSSRSKFKTK